VELDRHHERIRTRGINPVVYWITRAILQPFLLAYFRTQRLGREHIPRSGPVLLASNHRSFLDPFLIGLCLRRPIYFVAKRELFQRRPIGWFLNCLGAFPIRRGESDEEAVATVKAVLARGDAVVIFPEGTRIRTPELGRPKRGVGRFALECGAPVVPVAIHGTERARRGWLVKPVKCRVRCGRPLTFPRVETASQHLATEVTARIWPCIELQYRWLEGLPAVDAKPQLVPRPALATIGPARLRRSAGERDRAA
jgi:glycerol-3-phosphate dehydrogenase (NAD(P)+)